MGTTRSRRKVKSKDSYSARLKKKDWMQWKASQLRASWRSRAKKNQIASIGVPNRQEIQDWLKSKYPFKCYLTGESLTKTQIELDHKIPVSRGGTFYLNNVGITSKKNNSAKGDLTEEEYQGLLMAMVRWEDQGERLLSRLRRSNNIYRRKS